MINRQSYFYHYQHDQGLLILVAVRLALRVIKSYGGVRVLRWGPYNLSILSPAFIPYIDDGEDQDDEDEENQTHYLLGLYIGYNTP